MEPSSIKQLWQRIREEWQEVPAAFRPWGVWITYHAPLTVESDIYILWAQTVLRAWFSESMVDEPQEKSISMFLRFWSMQIERSWDHTGYASPDPWFSANHYAIGRTSFAYFADTHDIYLETVWAGLYGRGQHPTMNAEGFIQSVRTIWVA